MPVDGTAAALGLSKAACCAWEMRGFAVVVCESLWEACAPPVSWGKDDRTESREEVLL